MLLLRRWAPNRPSTCGLPLAIPAAPLPALSRCCGLADPPTAVVYLLIAGMLVKHAQVKVLMGECRGFQAPLLFDGSARLIRTGTYGAVRQATSAGSILGLLVLTGGQDE